MLSKGNASFWLVWSWRAVVFRLLDGFFCSNTPVLRWLLGLHKLVFCWMAVYVFTFYLSEMGEKQFIWFKVWCSKLIPVHFEGKVEACGINDWYRVKSLCLSFCWTRVCTTQLKFGKWNLTKIWGVLCWKLRVVHGGTPILKDSTVQKLQPAASWPGMNCALQFLTSVNPEQFMLWRVGISKFSNYFCLAWGGESK